MSSISKELAALDAVIEGATALAQEAMNRQADLKQGKLASEAMGRLNNAVKIRLESRLNLGRLVEVEARLINGREHSDAEQNAGTASALGDNGNRELPAA